MCMRSTDRCLAVEIRQSLILSIVIVIVAAAVNVVVVVDLKA